MTRSTNHRIAALETHDYRAFGYPRASRTEAAGWERPGFAVCSIPVQPGCHSRRLFQNWQEPDELVIEANWATEEDLVRHLQSETYKRLLLLMELGRSAPEVQFYAVEQVSGLDLVEKARNCIAQSE